MNQTIEMLPIVIAGAGPVGCAAALYLARKNLPVILLDSETELPKDLRASTFHPPTLDMLDELELTDSLIKQGLVVHNFQFRERKTNQVAKFHMKSLHEETKHPYRLQCEQYKMTNTVVEILKTMPNADVRMGQKILGFNEIDGRVDVLTYDGEQEEKIAASYLIGADGANSRVRQSAGIRFEGLTYPEMFLVASTTFPFEKHMEDLSWVNYISDPDEWCVMLKTVDLWRVQFPAPLDKSTEELLSDAFIQERLQRLVPNPDGYDIHHRTLYRVHQRVAETYLCGDYTVIIGDAAHVNNPLGGMGMNGGVHDAFNLCEKLIEIIFNGADREELLSLYDRQRRGICVEFIQEQTKKNKAMMESEDKDVQRNRQKRLMEACSEPVLEKSFLMQSSMIDSLKRANEIP